MIPDRIAYVKTNAVPFTLWKILMISFLQIQFEERQQLGCLSHYLTATSFRKVPFFTLQDTVMVFWQQFCFWFNLWHTSQVTLCNWMKNDFQGVRHGVCRHGLNTGDNKMSTKFLPSASHNWDCHAWRLQTQVHLQSLLDVIAILLDGALLSLL